MPSGPQGDHLFVILNKPADFGGYPPRSCVLVNLCTVRRGPYDTTRVIQPGAHPFVKRLTYVGYRHTRMEQESHLTKLVQARIFIPHQR